MDDGPYDAQYFDAQVEGALRSARALVPVLLELVQPASVVDVGCGRGAWLRAFQEFGVSEVRGVDGLYVEREKFLVSPEQFTAMDLRRPQQLSGRYDLALCLEVAEHLPKSVAPELVAALTRLSPVVVFSAAIPGQSGTEHVNEQWPEYWDGLFAHHSYRLVDAVRPRVYGDARIEWWYRQNVVLYASPEGLARWPRLASAASSGQPRLEWVHVDILRRTVQAYASIRYLGRALARQLTQRVTGRIRADSC